MRPKDLKTKIFLDSGDPIETKKIIKILGFLDGQTTNPTLIAKNPKAVEMIKKGKKFTKKEIYAFYKDVIQEISKLIPQGSVSVEVYADFETTSSQMLKEAEEMFSWIPNAHIKLPIIKEGLVAAHQAAQDGMRINMTLCFTQEQAAAVFLATKGASKGAVLISPFIGRLDDVGQNGISLISNILKSYRKDKNNHVEVLAASVRNLPHFLSSLSLECDIITAPFSVLSEWAEKGCPIPGSSYIYKTELETIPFIDLLNFPKDWRKTRLENELTKKGVEKFCADWGVLIA
ncbi:MAG: transaldolase [Candidatus Levybacteria bacterium]|nr:transaldolase [Candidatus Levybacteria bacterium]